MNILLTIHTYSGNERRVNIDHDDNDHDGHVTQHLKKQCRVAAPRSDIYHCKN